MSAPRHLTRQIAPRYVEDDFGDEDEDFLEVNNSSRKGSSVVDDNVSWAANTLNALNSSANESGASKVSARSCRLLICRNPEYSTPIVAASSAVAGRQVSAQPFRHISNSRSPLRTGLMPSRPVVNRFMTATPLRGPHRFLPVHNDPQDFQVENESELAYHSGEDDEMEQQAPEERNLVDDFTPPRLPIRSTNVSPKKQEPPGRKPRVRLKHNVNVVVEEKKKDDDDNDVFEVPLPVKSKNKRKDFSPALVDLAQSRKRAAKEVVPPRPDADDADDTSDEAMYDRARYVTNWVPRMKGGELVVEGDLLDFEAEEPNHYKDRWFTSKVVERRQPNLVITKGGPYVLEGKLNVGQARITATPQFVISAFKTGFPERWDMYKDQWRAFIKQQRAIEMSSDMSTVSSGVTSIGQESAFLNRTTNSSMSKNPLPQSVPPPSTSAPVVNCQEDDQDSRRKSRRKAAQPRKVVSPVKDDDEMEKDSSSEDKQEEEKNKNTSRRKAAEPRKIISPEPPTASELKVPRGRPQRKVPQKKSEAGKKTNNKKKVAAVAPQRKSTRQPPKAAALMSDSSGNSSKENNENAPSVKAKRRKPVAKKTTTKTRKSTAVETCQHPAEIMAQAKNKRNQKKAAVVDKTKQTAAVSLKDMHAKPKTIAEIRANTKILQAYNTNHKDNLIASTSKAAKKSAVGVSSSNSQNRPSDILEELFNSDSENDLSRHSARTPIGNYLERESRTPLPDLGIEAADSDGGGQNNKGRSFQEHAFIARRAKEVRKKHRLMKTKSTTPFLMQSESAAAGDRRTRSERTSAAMVKPIARLLQEVEQNDVDDDSDQPEDYFSDDDDDDDTSVANSVTKPPSGLMKLYASEQQNNRSRFTRAKKRVNQ